MRSINISFIFVLLAITAVGHAAGWRYSEPATMGTTQSGIADSGASTATKQAPTAAVKSAVSVLSANGNIPVNNMSAVNVRERFGEPQNEATPVGNPPISRWYYPSYTVYFEYDRVITSVGSEPQ